MTLDIQAKLDAYSERMPNGCREWRRGKNKGYGVVYWQGRQVTVHRLVCELTHGPSPEGKSHALHHCDNRSCIEGSHLYWGDNADNARDRTQRGRASGGRAGATHCIHGHEFTEENTYWEPRGWGRACKECRREAVRRMRVRKLVAA